MTFVVIWRYINKTELNWIHRLHRCKSKLSTISPVAEPSSPWCPRAPAASCFSHANRSSPFGPQPLTASQMCGQEITPNPEEIPLPNTQSLSDFQSFVFPSNILLRWKNRLPPSHGYWVKEIMAQAKLWVRGSSDKYCMVGQIFLDYSLGVIVCFFVLSICIIRHHTPQ